MTQRIELDDIAIKSAGSGLSSYCEVDDVTAFLAEYRKLDDPPPLTVIVDTNFTPKVKELLLALPVDGRLRIVCTGIDCFRDVRSEVTAPDVVEHANTFFTKEVMDSTNEKLYQVIRTWYLSEHLGEYRDKLAHRDVHIGSTVEWDLGLTLPRLFQAVGFLKALFMEKGGIVLIVTENSALMNAAKVVGSHLGLQVYLMNERHAELAPWELRERAELAIKFGLASFFDFIAAVLFFLRGVFKSGSVPSGLDSRENTIFVESIARLYPLADEVNRRLGHKPILIGFGGYMRRWLEAFRHRRTFLPFSYWLNPKALWLALVARKSARDLWDALDGHREWQEEVFWWEGLDLWPLLRNEFKMVVTSLFPRRTGQLESAAHWLTTFKPKLVVLDYDQTSFQRILCGLCKTMGIPTLHVHHGAHYGILAGSKPICDQINTDAVGMWGGVTKVWYDRQGFRDKKIYVTGSHLFDRLNHRFSTPDAKEKASARICSDLGLDPDKRIVTFASSYTANDTVPYVYPYGFLELIGMDILRPTLESISRHPSWQIVIKLHPLEKPDGYLELLAQYPEVKDRAVIIENAPLHDLIEASEFLVMPDSTVAIEGVMLGVPSVVALLAWAYDLPHIRAGAVLPVYRSEEVGSAVTSMIEDDDLIQGLKANRERFLEEGGYAVDGRSMDRLVECVAELLQLPTANA